MWFFISCLFLVLIFPNLALAKLSCKIGLDKCITSLGDLTSAHISKNEVGIFLNERKISSIITNDVNQAFVYYDLPYHKNKNKLIDKLIISYNSSDCIYYGQESNCQKYKVLDLINGIKLSSSFYPPIINANLMNVDWREGEIIMTFEDKSIFIYRNDTVKLNHGGVMSSKPYFDKDFYIKN